MKRYCLNLIRDPHELSSFKEHMLDCDECLDQLEVVIRFVDLVRDGIIQGGLDMNPTQPC